MKIKWIIFSLVSIFFMNLSVYALTFSDASSAFYSADSSYWSYVRTHNSKERKEYVNTNTRDLRLKLSQLISSAKNEGVSDDYIGSLVKIDGYLVDYQRSINEDNLDDADQAAINIDSEFYNMDTLYKNSRKQGKNLLYLYGAICFISLISSLITFIWSKKEIVDKLGQEPASQEAKLLRMNKKRALFQRSLFPFVGSIVTFFWYLYAYSKGGSYLILWGPVVFGMFSFASSLLDYFKIWKINGFENLAREAENLKKEALNSQKISEWNVKFRHGYISFGKMHQATIKLDLNAESIALHQNSGSTGRNNQILLSRIRLVAASSNSGAAIVVKGSLKAYEIEFSDSCSMDGFMDQLSATGVKVRRFSMQ